MVCASDQALKQGVRPGLPLAEARALLEEDACFLPLDASACRTALTRLALWCQRHFSPLVGIEEAELPECLLLDVTGCAPLFKGETELVRRVATACRQRGLRVRLALADTVGAAWALAHFAHDDISIVPPQEHPQALRPLPVEALRLPDESVRRLRDLDLCRIEQVQGLPRSSLPARFGPELLRRLDQALGLIAEPIRPVFAPGPIETSRAFEYPVRERRLLAQVLHELLAEAVARVATRGQGVRQIVCRIHAEHGPVEARIEARLLQASVALPRLWELVHLQLERAGLPREVGRASVRVQAAPLETEQDTFFDIEMRGGQRELAGLLERLSSRLGKSAVLRAQLTADAQPEFGFRCQPVLSSTRRRAVATTRRRADAVATRRRADAETRSEAGRGKGERGREGDNSFPRSAWECRSRRSASRSSLPLSASPHPRVLSPPLRLPTPRVVAALSVVPDGPPIRFHWRQREHRIVQAWGPERIETGWWRERYVRRDYYRVETESGQRYWLYRRLDDGQWFLHGIFE